MIGTLISMLDAAIAVHLPTVKRHGLAELMPIEGGTMPVVYADSSSFVQIANDNSGTFSYWRINGRESVASVDVKGLACGAFANSIPLRFVAMVDRTICPQVQDAARAALWSAIDADDSIRSVVRAISIDFNSTGVEADTRRVYRQEFGKELEVADKAFVAIDLSVVVTGDPACFDPCNNVGDFLCALIQRKTWAQIKACMTDAQIEQAIEDLCEGGPCPPTTVNGTESDTPTITVLQGGVEVGTLNPATGVHTVPECDPCDPFTATLGGHEIINEADPCGETVALTCGDVIDAVLVSGADEAQKNGLYSAAGQVNGRMSYELIPNHLIEWNGSQYILRDIFVGTDWITNNAPANPWGGVWVEFVGGAPIEATITQGIIGDICPCGDVEIIDQDDNVIASVPCGGTYQAFVLDSVNDEEPYATQVIINDN